jgi:hypothetical protein
MATIRKRRDKVRGPGCRAASGRLERDAEPAWHDRMATYKRYAEAASAIDKVWRDQVVRAIKDKKAPLERPADAEVPDQPPRPRVITMDTSTEALQRLLADNPRGLLPVRDELAGWVGSFDRYGGNGADRSFYLECWNGGAYVSDRIKFNDVPLRIKHTSLAILGGMVPDRLGAALADADDGLPARFILSGLIRCRSRPYAKQRCRRKGPTDQTKSVSRNKREGA